MKILELMEKRTKAIESARAFLKGREAVNNTEILSDEDTATYNRMESEINALSAAIEREGRLSSIEEDIKKPTSVPITGHPSPNQPPQPQTAADLVGEPRPRATNEYKADFGKAIRGKQPVYNVLSTSPDEDGGYLVPTEFEKQIVAKLQEYNVVRKVAKVVTTENTTTIPVAATHVSAKWVAENAVITEGSMTFEQKKLEAFKLGVLIKVSSELFQDSAFNLESYIANDFAKAFGAAEEEAFCVGTGVGQPTGIFTANGGEIGVTAGTTISTDNLIDLVYSLKSPYRRNAVFLMKDSTVAVVRKLKDSNGAYLWQPALQASDPDRLLGYPLYTSPHVPAIEAAALPIAFGDFSNYWVADRLGRTVQRLIELYAGNGQIGFVATQRVDGKVILAEGIKLLKMGGSSGG